MFDNLFDKNQFEIVSKYEGKGIKLPTRATTDSAGFDICSADEVSIPAIKTEKKPILVPTGIKVKMKKNYVLLLINRSSNPLKRGITLANGVGVIDRDYYNNDKNEGEIFGIFWNFSDHLQVIHKGERIMQGVFVKYDDLGNIVISTRNGGFGSTGK